MSKNQVRTLLAYAGILLLYIGGFAVGQAVPPNMTLIAFPLMASISIFVSALVVRRGRADATAYGAVAVAGAIIASGLVAFGTSRIGDVVFAGFSIAALFVSFVAASRALSSQYIGK